MQNGFKPIEYIYVGILVKNCLKIQNNVFTYTMAVKRLIEKSF